MAEVWAKGSSKKVGTPYLFLQPLKLATDGVAPCVAAGRVLQRLSFFAVFIAFSLTVLVMSYAMVTEIDALMLQMFI